MRINYFVKIIPTYRHMLFYRYIEYFTMMKQATMEKNIGWCDFREMWALILNLCHNRNSMISLKLV